MKTLILAATATQSSSASPFGNEMLSSLPTLPFAGILWVEITFVTLTYLIIHASTHSLRIQVETCKQNEESLPALIAGMSLCLVMLVISWTLTVRTYGNTPVFLNTIVTVGIYLMRSIGICLARGTKSFNRLRSPYFGKNGEYAVSAKKSDFVPVETDHPAIVYVTRRQFWQWSRRTPRH